MNRNRMASKYRQTVDTHNCVVNERKKIADSKITQSLRFENFWHAFLLLGVLETMTVLGFVSCRCSRAHRWTLPVKRAKARLRIKLPSMKALVIKRKPVRVLPSRALPVRRRLPVRTFPKMPPVTDAVALCYLIDASNK